MLSPFPTPPMKTAFRMLPIVAAVTIAVSVFTIGTAAAAKTRMVHLDAHGCVKSAQRWCVFTRRCIEKTAVCKKTSAIVAPRCQPKKCSDGREFATCSAQGYPINYFVDPCRKLRSSSSSLSPSSPSVRCVGCDRDAHGCIGSAGYTWCAVKNRCLRTWEEACK